MRSIHTGAVSAVAGDIRTRVLMGRYEATMAGPQMHCPVIVDSYHAGTRRWSLPVVAIPGAGMPSLFWLRTPDDREGWGHRLLAAGVDVHFAGHPRAMVSDDILGAGPNLTLLSARVYERLFTASARFDEAWPTARRHRRWPGGGRQGDPLFDMVFAAQEPFIEDTATAEVGFREAVRPFVEAIGPVILLTHSRGACLGWALADACPGKVAAIVAVEPVGPPAVDYFSGLSHLAFGVTNSAISFDPPVAGANDLAWACDDAGPDGVRDGWVYDGVPRCLTALRSVPALVVTGEASYHAAFDHRTVGFLRRMGVDVAHWRLEDFGITGNGHLMMLESNSDEIIDRILDWMTGIAGNDRH